jgi:hypothetical protein
MDKRDACIIDISFYAFLKFRSIYKLKLNFAYGPYIGCMVNKWGELWQGYDEYYYFCFA